MQQEMDIHALVAQAAVALTELGLAQDSGRVRDVPSVRTVRYYGSHGLLDRPLRYIGRRAVYGARHLQQLVAIKRLQARGLDLATIQHRLAALDDDALRDLAALTAAPPPDVPLAGDDEAEREEEAFWERMPVEPEPVALGLAQQEVAPQALRLSPELLLVIDGALRPLDDDDRRALQAAAEPLRKLLERRRLTPFDPR